MFNMNQVFEKFITEELRRATTGTHYQVKAQSSAEHLATKVNSTGRPGKPVFRLKPDISVFDNGILKCLIDTKWKKLRTSENKEPKPKYFRTPENTEPVSQTDMYQMFAYAHKYRCSVILIYPHHSDIGRQTQPPACRFLEYHCGDTEETYIIMVCTVDITIDLGRATERERLQMSLLGLIQNLVEELESLLHA
jgi:5-methylcytosine-specific restriction enzyme subunit McrC